jgi:hypothetical protein
MAVVVALGVIAGGAVRPTDGDSRASLVGLGAVLWIVLLVGTLFGYI